MIMLTRLYVENYKLFPRKEIDFSNSRLLVFDGPNGYGKTSIFDAIELLVTGKMSRVIDCESIDGKLAYQTVFFAQNCEKDVILKAEFRDDAVGRSFVLGAKVKSSDVTGKMANPKSIFESIRFFCLPKYDISIDLWDNYYTSTDRIETIRKQEFGEHNIEQFTLFHYIRQEDRLAYFKQSETARSTTIEDLLGVAIEKQKFRKIQEKRKALDKTFIRISDEIKTKREQLIDHDDKSERAIDYEPLIDGIQAWDQKEVFFGKSNEDKILAQYFTELEKIELYAKYAEFHNVYFSYKGYIELPEKNRNNALLALILLHKTPVSIDTIDISNQNLIFLKQQRDIIESQEYNSVNLSKICKVVGISENESLATSIKMLNDTSRNQGELQKAINNVIHIRENLRKEHSQISRSGVCPYCGYSWKNSEELEKQFASTKTILQNLLTQDGEVYAKQIEIVKDKIEKCVLSAVNAKISELSGNEIISVYAEFDSKAQFVNAIENVRPLYEISKKTLANTSNGTKSITGYWKKMIEICMNVGNTIPIEYLAADEKYTFTAIKKQYALDEGTVSKLQKKRIDNKRQYLQEQFYKSFDRLKEEIQNLESKRDAIDSVKTQLKGYEIAVKNSIEAYKKQIIDEIEIPFFVYSSRLLQSYQGGQGVLMKNDGETIRFTSPGSEHDILYTMSSGQLSAVLLSFSLALNKMYSGKGIKTVLIDDPIQCMDDINMISFVELLRREFSECQIIMSTHEEDFSNYVRYKFKKYGIETQAITLKDA